MNTSKQFWLAVLFLCLWAVFNPVQAEPLKMGRATWDTGWFQAEIYRQLVADLGYEVAPAETVSNPSAYKKIEAGKLDFWPTCSPSAVI